MGWASATSIKPKASPSVIKTTLKAIPKLFAIARHKVDWAKLVTLDFETYFDANYTLRKLSTSEYIRDARFKAQMVGVKIGNKVTKIVTKDIAKFLKSIDWSTHSLLCHNAQFDGFILSHHYGVQPKFIYDTLSMARGLLANDIGASLDEVAQYYGKGNKIPDVLEETRGVLNWSPSLTKRAGLYCAQDVNLTLEIFKEMLEEFPANEIELINLTVKMFTDPVLKVDLPLVEKELVREIAEKERLLLSSLGNDKQVAKMLATKQVTVGKEKTKLKEMGITEPTNRDILLCRAKFAIGSNETFAQMLRDLGVEPPMKISPAWIKAAPDEKDPAKKYAYAFAQTDLAFKSLLEHPSQKIRDLVETRLSVKSTTNETRAIRFLNAGANGLPLPVFLKYAGAHTWRWSGGNKMNMQNLKREDPDDPQNTGILRKSILAPKGHHVCVVDSGQIEARVNGWLWDQDDLIDSFRDSDAGKGSDAYCNFASKIYGRVITKKDKLERFVGKVAVLGLGYQMGAAKFQNTLALGNMGPPVFLSEALCKSIVNTYRRENFKIKQGWDMCANVILPGMARGVPGTHKCISWDKDCIYLPNGTKLKYPNLKLSRNAETDWDEWTYERKGERVKIYGGLLCENLVQALARIIVAEQMLDIAKDGHRVVTMTHDEVVTIAKVAKAQKCYNDMMKRMRQAPDWCADIPLNCEGGHDVNYSK